jgi:hypothetical protein
VPAISSQYKDLFYRKFKEAYDSGLNLTGDAIADDIIPKWTPDDATVVNEKKSLLKEMTAMWDEWNYAIRKYKP